MSRPLEVLWLDGKFPSVIVPITARHSSLALEAIEQLGMLADEIVGGLNVPNWCDGDEVRGKIIGWAEHLEEAARELRKLTGEESVT